jgi:hypothetical protein
MSKGKLFDDKTPEQVAAAEAQVLEQSKRIEFYLTEYTVELLAQKVKDKQFVVPAYQRDYTWEPERKSKFIESLIIGLPIPFIFFWEMPDGRLEIVDGSQRLRTIEEFVLGDLELGELESLTALSGFKFSDLPVPRQRKITNKSIRGIVLNEHADEQARFDLFERINTGSKIANKAEVRRGALAGPFMDLIISLANSPEFVNLAPVSSKDAKEREREELVTRYFAYSSGLEGYKDRPSEFLFKFVKKMNLAVQDEANLLLVLRSDFERTIRFVGRVFPYGFRKSFTGKATPRARFEAIAVGSKIAIDQDPGLLDRIGVDVAAWLEGDDFTKVTGSDGANAVARLRERTNFVRDKLLG